MLYIKNVEWHNLYTKKNKNRRANRSINRITNTFTKILIYSYYTYKNTLSFSRLKKIEEQMVMPNEEEQVPISNNWLNYSDKKIKIK
jgi:hypothetical protein